MPWYISLTIAAAFVVAIFSVTYAIAPPGWRTRIANIVSGVTISAGLILQYLVQVPWTQAFDAKTALFIGIGLNLLNIAYREVTDSPAGQPLPPEEDADGYS